MSKPKPTEGQRLVQAYAKYKQNNPQVFDCTTLEMHPAHHRFLANRLEDAFQSGWNAAAVWFKLSRKARKP